MADNNGKSFRIIMYLVGVLVSLVCFVVIPTMAGNMITNDKDSRDRDVKMREDHNIHVIQAQKTFNDYAMKQQQYNATQMVILEGMAKDIQYMRQNGV